ncbi:MAG: response regulator [Desulfococcaceae bacterium]|jgi:DNA-binding NtrC family response regulator|nr:response regulator [Desulfococcaceae bacterium]
MNPFRVLIVDDETDFLNILVKRLTKRGITVFRAENGMDALELLEKEAIDVVVLDVRMPGMDGIQTLRAIKEKDAGTEVIMLTGHANIEVAVRGMELGAFDYLMKPMNMDELVFKLQDAYQARILKQKKGHENAAAAGHDL